MLRVLGGIEVDGHGAVRSPAQRTLLSALILDRGAVVSTDRLADLLWGADQPANPTAALQSQVSRVRSLLPAGAVIEARGPGYRLDLDPADLDVAVFDDGLSSARSAPPASCLDIARTALTLWRGSPFADLADDDRARAEASRLEAGWRSLRELQAESLLATGRIHEAIGELEGQRRESPLRERTVELLMRAYVEAGRRNEALAAFQDLRAAMIEALGLDPSPALRELEVAILTENVVATQPTTPTEMSIRPNGVELPTSSFVGRDHDLERVLRALGQQHIVTLVGPGGVGKTRLGTHAAARAASRHSDGVVMIELSSIRDPGRLGDLLVSALDLRPRTGVSALDLALDALVEQDLLLVLDNCEHVIDAVAGFTETAVRRSTGLRVLATSREPLNVDGEQVERIQPLAGTEAVALFTDRAAGHHPFVLDARSRPLVEQICLALDRLPLAIELAAARSVSMSLQELVDGLHERFALLTQGRRTAPERHQSLWALIDWSVQSLEEPLADLLTKISVFSAPFTAAAVGAAAGLSEHEALDSIGELVDRSLLIEYRTEGRRTRYGFLETIRAYARERLDRADHRQETVERHSAWVLAQVEELRSLMPDRPDAEPAQELMAMLADVRVVQRRLLDTADPDRSLRLAAALHYLAFLRMHTEMFGWITEVADRFGDADHPLAEDVLGSASIGTWLSGDLDGARHYAERADRRGRDGTYPGAGRAAAEAWGDVLQFGGDDGGAFECFDRAAGLAREQDDPARVVANLVDGGMILGYTGELDRARTAISTARQLMGRDGSALMEAWVCYAEGEALAEADPELAIEALDRALELADRCSLHFITGVAGLTQVGLQVRGRDPATAVPGLIDLLEHWRRAGAGVQQAISLRMVVDLLVRVGRCSEAGVILGALLSSETEPEATGADAERLRVAREAVFSACSGAETLLERGAALETDEVVALAIRNLRDLLPGT